MFPLRIRSASLQLSRSLATLSPSPRSSPSYPPALKKALETDTPLHDWTKPEIESIYHMPLLSLIHHASIIHHKFHDPSEVQLCTLMNIKTGGCSEDCKYCAQSSRYDTGLKAEKIVTVEQVYEQALKAKENGSTRFCMGAAWRDMRGRKSNLKRIAQMVEKVNSLGLESCVTLGMVENEDQVEVLKNAGLTAYNHNVDTSREFYPKVISTRSYDDRLKTIATVRKGGVKVCSGGILGLGESTSDHIGFLHTLSTMEEHPESVPINRLVPIKGTPLGNLLEEEFGTEEDDGNNNSTGEKKKKKKSIKLPFDAILRTAATARLLMPSSVIRLAAGRYTMKETDQAMCFLAGVNAIFTGEKMLTTMCNGWDEDKAMLERWGLKPMKSFERTIVDPSKEKNEKITTNAKEESTNIENNFSNRISFETISK